MLTTVRFVWYVTKTVWAGADAVMVDVALPGQWHLKQQSRKLVLVECCCSFRDHKECILGFHSFST